MVSQNVSRMEFSHQTRDLVRFADRYNNPWNRPPIFIQTWLQQYGRGAFFFTLRTALSAIPFVSDLCGVNVQWFQERSSQALLDSKELSVFLSFGFLSGSKNFLQAPLCFLRSICFARIWLDPLGGQVLHHDCISMIASRFTTFTENFVICCYQVTKIFCTRYGSANASTARGSCDCGLFKDLAIFVFREVSTNTVFTQIRTSRRRGLSRWFMRRLACESLHSGTLSSTRFSLNSCSRSGFSEHNGSPGSNSGSAFLFGFGFGAGLVNASLRSLLWTCSLDTDTG